MARKPRYTLSGMPQHIIQRGHNREPCFFMSADSARYLDALEEQLGSEHNFRLQLTSEVMAMGKSKLSVICGLKISDAVLAEGDAGISFENGISLAIYNRYELEGFALSDAQRLFGNIVSHVDEGTDSITISFENNWALRIDMRDEAYTGPEALQLRVPGEPIVIWS